MANPETLEFWVDNEYPAQIYVALSSLHIPKQYDYPAHEYITRSNIFQPEDIWEFNASAVMAPLYVILAPILVLGVLLDDGQSHRR